MIIFSLYRYIVVLELLAPICFLVLIDRFGLPRPAQWVAVLFAVLLLGGGMLYSARVYGGVDAFTGGRLHWTERFFEVDATPFESPDSTIVVMLGPSPMAFVIPELPPEMRFLRPEGNLHLRERNGLYAEVTSSLKEHTGAVYIMFSDPPSKPFNPMPRARRLGLEYDPTQCFSLDHNRTYTVIRFCKVR
jgi:hypothetical protein